MAIKYQEIKAKLETAPFTIEESNIINKVENYIDTKIKEKFDGGDVNIQTEVLSFKFNPDAPSECYWNVWPNIKTTRKTLMSEELKRRFEDAGWKWKFYQGADDGPNRPGAKYWILNGKK